VKAGEYLVCICRIACHYDMNRRSSRRSAKGVWQQRVRQVLFPAYAELVIVWKPNFAGYGLCGK
jgi:hypothetical protein